jgi:diphosphomevalonate decarboxylase
MLPCTLPISEQLLMQVAPSHHWPELEVLVLVVSDQKKLVSSTAGMQTSVKTSSLMAERVNTVVPQRMREMEKAIAERDFESFGRITMQV